jgi:hypothetical protein
MKRALRKPRHRFEDNLKWTLQKGNLQKVEWFRLAQDRLQRRGLGNNVMNLQFQYRAGIH